MTTMITPAVAPFGGISVGSSVGSQPSGVVEGDFTGDGHLDLAVANYDVR